MNDSGLIGFALVVVLAIFLMDPAGLGGAVRAFVDGYNGIATHDEEGKT